MVICSLFGFTVKLLPNSARLRESGKLFEVFLMQSFNRKLLKEASNKKEVSNKKEISKKKEVSNKKEISDKKPQ